MSPLESKQVHRNLILELSRLDRTSQIASTQRRSRFSLTAPAILGMARHGLQYELSGVVAGIAAIIRSERGAVPSAQCEPDSLAILAFIIAANPDLAAEWTEALLSRVAVFEDEPGDTFSFNDYQYRVHIVVSENVVTHVSPLPKRATAKHHG